MHRHIWVNRYPLCRQSALHAGKICGCAFTYHTKKTVCIGAKRFLVYKVAPTADCLPQRKTGANNIAHFQRVELADFTHNHRCNQCTDNTAVNCKTTITDVYHINKTVIFKRRKCHIVCAGTHNCTDCTNHQHINIFILVNSASFCKVKGHSNAKHCTKGNQHTVPVNIHPENSECHTVNSKFDAQFWELYIIHNLTLHRINSKHCPFVVAEHILQLIVYIFQSNFLECFK